MTLAQTPFHQVNPIDPWLARLAGQSDPRPDPVTLAALQLALLRESLRQAMRTRFYPEHYRRLSPDILQGMRQGLWPDLLADLTLLPTVEADHLAKGAGNGWQDLLAASQDDIARMVSLNTSGTTGPPKRLAFGQEDLAATLEFFAVGLRLIVEPGQILLVLLPGSERRAGVADLILRSMPWLDHPDLGLAETRTRLFCERPTGGATGLAADPAARPADFCRALLNYHPHGLVATPGQLRKLLNSAAVGRTMVKTGSLKKILSSGEPLDPDLRMQLEARWQVRVLDHYGLTESVYGCAVQCAAQDGFHLRQTDLFLEILRPGSDLPLPVGQSGELVLTSLGQRVMPLIRYRTGDQTRFLDRPCACGSSLPCLDKVAGRLAYRGGSDYYLIRPKKGEAHARLFQSDH